MVVDVYKRCNTTHLNPPCSLHLPSPCVYDIVAASYGHASGRRRRHRRRGGWRSAAADTCHPSKGRRGNLPTSRFSRCRVVAALVQGVASQRVVDGCVTCRCWYILLEHALLDWARLALEAKCTRHLRFGVHSGSISPRLHIEPTDFLKFCTQHG